MHTVIVLLGGNEGDIKNTFQQSISKMQASGFSLEKQSYIYQSKAWGYESENLFFNQALILNTNYNPQQTLSKMLDIEKDLGRTRNEQSGYKDRLIDIDIMFFDDMVLNTKELCIPHPRLHLRKFCLVPLNELVPGFEHPVFKKLIHELLTICPDQSEVIPI